MVLVTPLVAKGPKACAKNIVAIKYLHQSFEVASTCVSFEVSEPTQMLLEQAKARLIMNYSIEQFVDQIFERVVQ